MVVLVILYAQCMLVCLAHVSNPPYLSLYLDLEWMVIFGKSCLGVNVHSLPFLISQGERILALGCHELGRDAILRRVCPCAPDAKSSLPIPLVHPIPCWNVVRLFSDHRLYFDTVFNLIV